MIQRVPSSSAADVQHLIHIGFPKAGSTFLQSWFSQHPQLQYRNGGIGGFDDLYGLVKTGCIGTEHNLRYFVTSFEGIATPRENADQLWNDAPTMHPRTPQQCRRDQKKICALLKSLFPAAQILIITRGYEGIILSGYSQYLRTGGKSSFPEMMELFRSEAYRHFINYDSVIDLYAQAFGKENLIVMPFELLRDDADHFLSILEERLAIEHVAASPGIVNPSLTSQQMYWYRQFSTTTHWFTSRLGERLHLALFPLYVKCLFHEKFNGVMKILSAVMPSKKIVLEIPPETLLWCAKGDSLRDHLLYRNYRKEYLLD